MIFGEVLKLLEGHKAFVLVSCSRCVSVDLKDVAT